ncbi:MAG TPA: PIN domain-containing protein [Gemmataceae bacterium]|nr:PIN domain-containing protein [Gemmataceae bacterium]
MNAVDTNIFLYSLDKHEPAKQAKAQQLLQRLRSAPEPTFLLWQVQGELVQQLRHWRDQGKLTAAEFLQHVQAFRYLFPLVLPVPAVLDRALDLSGRYSLSHWDSMILGACLEGGITTLYTEDMGAPRTIDTIQLVNPLI